MLTPTPRNPSPKVSNPSQNIYAPPTINRHNVNAKFLCHENQTQLLLLSLLSAWGKHYPAQLLPSEITPTNPGAFADEDGDYPDWLEIYNAGNAAENLEGVSLSDGGSPKWALPATMLGPGERLLVFASGKNRGGDDPTASVIDHWETALYDEDTWQYWTEESSLPTDWNQIGSSNANWQSGMGGFGYGDGDDNTPVAAGSLAFFYRQKFTVSAPGQLVAAILSMDYDDAFVAYLNGVEVARSLNMQPGAPSSANPPTTDHEAAMYNGGDPETFQLDSALITNTLAVGENVMAIALFNIDGNSSDLTGRTWLHFGTGSAAQFFGPNPSWFAFGGGGGGTALHTNFKLSFGERLSLFDAAGNVLDSVTIQPLEPGHSMMRTSDSGNWCLTDVPTPDAANPAICYSGYATVPTFSLPAGFYQGSQSVGISGTAVRYTTNGSQPTGTSTSYGQPLNVNTTRVLRARSFEAGLLPSPVATATYFINDPTELPVLAISARPGDLFYDSSGGPAVYDDYGSGKRAACKLEYFDKDNNFAFTENASIRPVGNYSIAFEQKGLQFIFDEDFGAKGEVSYPIFGPDKPGIQSYKGFRIRNTDDDASTTRIRDLVANRITLPTHCAAAGCQSMAVFINGQYWGHYEGRELLNEYYARDNFGMDPERVDMLKTAYGYANPYFPEEGSDTAFYTMSNFILDNDMDDPANFAQAQSLIDLENWVDYFASEIYTANVDWFSSIYFNNTRIFRGGHNDAFRKKWRFVLWDMGSTQGVYNGVGYDMLNEALAAPAYNNRWTDMMNQLLVNAEFKRYFINRFADLLNEYWTPTKTHAIIDAAAVELEGEIPRQSQRWGTASLGSWQDAVQYLRDYHTEKPAVQRQQINSFFNLNGQVNVMLQVQPPGAGWVKISTITPKDLPWTGIYFKGNPVTVTAIAAPGYSFDHWTTNPFISDPNAPGFTTNITANTSFTAHFTGAAQQADLQVVEINYHSDPTRDAGDWLELKNESPTPLDVSDYLVGDKDWFHRFRLPTGTVLPTGGRLVVYEAASKFAEQHSGVTNAVGGMGFGLGDDGDEIRLLDRFGEPLQTLVFNDKKPWPCTPDGFGRSLELREGDTPTLPESWFDGCVGGSPGEAYSTCEENPIISEINYKSAAAADAGDWLELHNRGSQPLSLGGWQIRDDDNGHAFTILNGTVVPAGGYQVFVEDAAKFAAQFPNVANYTGPLGFGLNGDGDVIRLYDAQGVLQNSLCYDDAAPWTEDADGFGYTLENADFAGNANDPSNWFSGCYGGSPGTAFDPDCLLATEEKEKQSGIIAYPNPVGEVLSVRLENGAWARLRLVDSLGRVVLERRVHGAADLALGGLAVGAYWLSLVDDSGRQLGRPILVSKF
ncbi:MAG: lamin tail domain-containing protein [Saprospiraceae bacterium]|nr:lamin tail domain-containing protein [Saprospiraceae bacterium]